MALQSWLRRTILPAAAMLLAFGVAGEIALRVAGFHYPPAAVRDVIWSRARDPELFARTFHERDRLQIWKPIPGAAVPWAPGERLNSAGFRGAEVPLERTPGVARIAILGSNEALGVGMPWELCWPRFLQQAIEEKGEHAEILCAAVQDSTLRQGMERWNVDVQRFRPDLLICTYSGEMESRAAPCGCSDSQRILDNCGHGFPDYRERRQLVPAFAKRSRGVQLLAWMGDVLDGSYWDWRVRTLAEERLAPAADGFDVGGARRVGWKEYCELAVQLRDRMEALRIRLIFFPITGEKAVRNQSAAVRGYQTMLIDAAEEHHISRLSALDAFDKAVRAGARVEDFYANGQLSEGGHRFLCHELGKLILPRLADLRR